MGFIIFNQSGTFNPLSFGLNVGDTMNVICVGGGGGGGACYSGAYLMHGGTGGTSSFGSYVSSLGGGGGGYSGTSNYSTQGQYLGGLPCGGSTYGKGAGGGGAGGWIPGTNNWGGKGLNGYDCSSGGIQWCQSIRKFDSPIGSAGMGGLFNTLGQYYYPNGASNATGYCTFGGFNMLSENAVVPSPLSYQYQSNCCLYGIGAQGLYYGGGAGGGLANTYSSALVSGVGGSGGSGYGAGGGGASPNNYYHFNAGGGGNSGQVVSINVTLTSISSIAVSVGGGGSGAYTYNSGGAHGADGGSGSYGAATNGGNRGGYAGICGGSGSSFNYDSYYEVAGGGAGGCVAIYW